MGQTSNWKKKLIEKIEKPLSPASWRKRDPPLFQDWRAQNHTGQGEKESISFVSFFVPFFSKKQWNRRRTREVRRESAQKKMKIWVKKHYQHSSPTWSRTKQKYKQKNSPFPLWVFRGGDQQNWHWLYIRRRPLYALSVLFYSHSCSTLSSSPPLKVLLSITLLGGTQG